MIKLIALSLILFPLGILLIIMDIPPIWTGVGIGFLMPYIVADAFLKIEEVKRNKIK